MTCVACMSLIPSRSRWLGFCDKVWNLDDQEFWVEFGLTLSVAAASRITLFQGRILRIKNSRHLLSVFFVPGLDRYFTQYHESEYPCKERSGILVFTNTRRQARIRNEVPNIQLQRRTFYLESRIFFSLNKPFRSIRVKEAASFSQCWKKWL